MNLINFKTPNQKKISKMEKIVQQYNEKTITKAEYVKMISHYYADII